MEEERLTEKIIGCAMKVHSLLNRLSGVRVCKGAGLQVGRSGLKVECEKAITVKYDGVIVGEFSTDKLVEEKVIVEEKAVHALVPAHEVQLVNYLTATALRSACS